MKLTAGGFNPWELEWRWVKAAGWFTWRIERSPKYTHPSYLPDVDVYHISKLVLTFTYRLSTYRI